MPDTPLVFSDQDIDQAHSQSSQPLTFGEDDIAKAPEPRSTVPRANLDPLRAAAQPQTRPYPKFSDVVGSIWNQPDKQTQAAVARNTSPQTAASKAAGMPLADVTGRPQEPQGEEYIGRDGMVHRRSAVPEADAFPILDAWKGVEPVATGLSRMTENAPKHTLEDPHMAMFQPPLSAEDAAEEEKRRRQRSLGAAEVLQGGGELMTPVAVGAGLVNPLPVVAGYGAGLAASKGTGAAVHGHVSPEDEELIRTLSMFAPSALGVVSGLRTGSVETPQGKFSAASIFGGRAGAGVRTSPEGTFARVKVGGTTIEVPLSRTGGATPEAPAPAPASAPPPARLTESLGTMVNAKATEAMAKNVAQGLPPTPPAPPPPPTEAQQFGNKLSGAQVDHITQAIAAHPPEARNALIEEAHNKLTQWIAENGGKVIIDGKIHIAKTPEQAETLSAKLINDGVTAHDKATAEAAKAQEKATPEQPAKPAAEVKEFLAQSRPPAKVEELQAPNPKPVQASLGNEAPVVPQESQTTQNLTENEGAKQEAAPQQFSEKDIQAESKHPHPDFVYHGTNRELDSIKPNNYYGSATEAAMWASIRANRNGGEPRVYAVPKSEVEAGAAEKLPENAYRSGAAHKGVDVTDELSGIKDFPFIEPKKQPERRTNMAERKRVADMSEAEKDKELLTAPKTGLLNSRAFDESGLEESHPHVGFADVDDFKSFNTAFGHKGVDTTVLPAIGEMFRRAINKEPAGHIHAYQQTAGSAGDEFLMRSKTPEAIKRVMERINKELAGTEFEYRKPDGTIVKKKGTGLKHGIGDDPESAEADSEADKQRRTAAGLRSGERDVPAVDSRSATGERTAVSDAAGRAEVHAEEPAGEAASEVAPQTFHESEIEPQQERTVEELVSAMDAITDEAKQRREESNDPAIRALRPTDSDWMTPEEASQFHELQLEWMRRTQAERSPEAARKRVEEKRAARLAQEAPEGIPAKGQAGRARVDDLTVAPKEFQYKLNTNEHGVTNLLSGQKWNDDLAGVISVWHNPADGKTYVVNGHHRVQLAKENGVHDLLVRHLDVNSASEARLTGALQNIAEGRGTAVDAAKFFRESGISLADLSKHGISLGEAKAADGMALSKLDQSIFERVATGKMSEGRGVAIGQATSDPAQQEAIVKLLDKREAKGKSVTDGTVAELARFVGSSGNKTIEQGGLFGANQQIHSLALEKAEISAYIKSQIAKERRVFGSVASEDKAAALGQVKGQKLKAEQNKRIADAAGQAEEAYNKLSSHTGPVNDILEKSAKELASGYHKPEDVKTRAYQAVRAELRKAVTGSEGPGAERVQEHSGHAAEDAGNADRQASVKPSDLEELRRPKHKPDEPALPGMGDSPAPEGKYVAGQKYHQSIPEITHLPPSLLQRMNSSEVGSVSSEIAQGMKFHEPVEASLYSDGEIRISDGHHRVAAAKQLGMKSVPVTVHAINATGEKINKLIGMSRNLQAEHPALPGMEPHLEAEKESIAATQGEDLSRQIAAPKESISAKAGEMERNSPLFRDTEASGQSGLFNGDKIPDVPADKGAGSKPSATSKGQQAEIDKIATLTPRQFTNKYVIHFDLRPGADERVDSIMGEGLRHGWTFADIDPENKTWNWFRENGTHKSGARAYVLRYSDLKESGNGMQVKPGTKPLTTVVLSKDGQTVLDAIKEQYSDIASRPQSGGISLPSKGDTVTLADGRKGEVQFVDANMNVARVKVDGKSVTVGLKSLKDKSGEAGFARLNVPSAVADMVKAAHEKVFAPTENRIARGVDDTLYQLGKQYDADVLRTIKLLKSVGPTTSPEDQEAIYHHKEDSAQPLTARQKANLDGIVQPLMDVNSEMRAKLNKAGVPMGEDDGYIHRVVQGKNNQLERAMKGKGGTGKGNVLSKAASSLKGRSMFAAEDEDGKRVVIHRNGDTMTAFDNGRASEFAKDKSGLQVGDEFNDKDGQPWTLKQATTKEIEQHTGIRYYKNALASTVTDYLQLRRAERANDALNAMKADPEFKSLSFKPEHGEMPPDGWRMVNLPQFNGYYFEKHLAETLDRFADDLRMDPAGYLERAGNIMTASLVLNPARHIYNIGNHWLVERGVTGNFNPLAWPRSAKAGIRAIKAVMTQNDDFVQALDRGAPMMSHRQDLRELHKHMVDSILGFLDKNPTIAKKIAEATGFPNPLAMGKALYGVGQKITWMSNDVFFLQSIYEKELGGMSFEDAAKETAKHIPDYRIPARVLNSHGLSTFMNSHLLTVFSRYHYGVWKSYGQMLKEVAGPESSLKDRGKGLDHMLMLGLLTFVAYEMWDKLLKHVTGDARARMVRSGASAIPYLVNEIIKGNRPPDELIQGTFTPAVLPKTVYELATNRDSYSGSRIYDRHDPAGTIVKDISKKVGGALGPTQQYQKAERSDTPLRDLLAYQTGVTFPNSEVQSPAVQLMHELLRESMAMTPDLQKQLDDKKARAAAGKLTVKEMKSAAKKQAEGELMFLLPHLSYSDIKKVDKVASPEEQQIIKPIMLKKALGILRNNPYQAQEQGVLQDLRQ